MTTPDEMTDQDWYREFVCTEPILTDITLADVVAATAFLRRQSAPATYQALAKAQGVQRSKAYSILLVLEGLGIALRRGRPRAPRFSINVRWNGDVAKHVRQLAGGEPAEFTEEQRILGVLTLASFGALSIGQRPPDAEARVADPDAADT